MADAKVCSFTKKLKQRINQLSIDFCQSTNNQNVMHCTICWIKITCATDVYCELCTCFSFDMLDFLVDIILNTYTLT